ncbi:hypothetical protein Gohar_006925 [Gossypium harknessii]|uniref:DUF4283 domain-containing protein n=1 Tax=Gossypium harknessii TaxID=34285 RepID=A0A7J9GFL7_9ROSI|nr:hypothetical protein [Gossypium harknessii]
MGWAPNEKGSSPIASDSTVDRNGMDIDRGAPYPPSFQDTLLGSPPYLFQGLDMDDIMLEDSDMLIGDIDGIVFNVLLNILFAFWKLLQRIQMMDLENYFYLVKFLDGDNYSKALTDKHWVILGNTLRFGLGL